MKNWPTTMVRNNKNMSEDMAQDSHNFIDQPSDHKGDNTIDKVAHYNMGKLEVIDVIEDWDLGFSLGNAVKYIARAGHKDPDKEVQDLEKALWYIKRHIEMLKRKT